VTTAVITALTKFLRHDTCYTVTTERNELHWYFIFKVDNFRYIFCIHLSTGQYSFFQSKSLIVAAQLSVHDLSTKVLFISPPCCMNYYNIDSK
jgi:hypothetical protein